MLLGTKWPLGCETLANQPTSDGFIVPFLTRTTKASAETIHTNTKQLPTGLFIKWTCMCWVMGTKSS